MDTRLVLVDVFNSEILLAFSVFSSMLISFILIFKNKKYIDMIEIINVVAIILLQNLG